MKITVIFLSLLICLSTVAVAKSKFISVEGKEIIGTDGKPFLIKGTNLGNWLVPEGYMFKFKTTNSPKLINDMFSQILGPDETGKFWKTFIDNYVTVADIHFLKTIGVNSIRVPFNYKLFCSENYMGSNDPNHGFQLLDRVINWCKSEGIYVILDMHCAPGGQTGDNIDDGYGYPFLFESSADRALAVRIWKKIASKYKNEPTVIGYDLLNEPVAHYFDSSKLNPFIEPFYKEVTAAIRSVDQNHIIFLGGAQWNTNFQIFGAPFDAKLVYTFHKYGDEPSYGSIKRFVEFRNQYNVPIYAGETGENTDAWVQQFRELLEQNNIGWHFWPYKKLDNPKNLVSVPAPVNYDQLIQFSEAPRQGFKALRDLKFDRDSIKSILYSYLENCKFSNCKVNDGYVKALGFASGGHMNPENLTNNPKVEPKN